MYRYFTDGHESEPMLWRADERNAEYLAFDLTWQDSAFFSLADILEGLTSPYCVVSECTESRAYEIIEMYSC